MSELKAQFDKKPLDGLNILVVDDHRMVRFFTIEAIRERGAANVFEAVDGVDALEVLKREQVDFMLTDGSMPEMNGIELIKAVRADPALKDLPIILMSLDDAYCKEAEKQGVVAAMEKPADFNRVAALIAGSMQAKSGEVKAGPSGPATPAP